MIVRQTARQVNALNGDYESMLNRNIYS